MAEIIPSTIIVSDVTIEHNIPNYSTTSMSEKVKSRTKNMHFLTGDITLTAGERAVGRRAIEGFLLRCRGRLMELEIPLNYTAADAGGAPTITGNHSAGATSIAVAGIAGSFFVGDIVKFPNDNKLYYVLTDITGAGAMEIFPPLRIPQASGNPVLYTDLNPFARLTDDTQSVKYNEQGIITETTISWKESL